MTSRKEEEKEEGILEQMLESLESIGQDVERIMYRTHFYNSPRGQDEDELTFDELYENENGEY